MIQKLCDGLKKIPLELSEGQINQLEQYISAVLEFNQTYNLMKADSADELAVNHVLDSLVAVPHIKKLAGDASSSGSVSIGDIGSGGGCPGIPLATALPEYSFTLVERMEKRCAFLESAVSRMGLTNVKVLCAQADTVDPEIFDIEVFRAFHPFDKKITKLLFRMLKKGGHIAAYKARSEKIAQEMEEIKMMIDGFEKIPMTVPFLEDHERNLVVIKK